MPADTLLVYHNAAYPRLKDCRLGTANDHLVIGAQSHITALNAAGRQVVSQRPRCLTLKPYKPQTLFSLYCIGNTLCTV